MGWDEEAGRTVVQRTKESADDYRYFPEPDLPPLRVDPSWVAELRTRVGELPDAKAGRFQRELGLEPQDAAILVEDRAVAEYYEAALMTAGGPSDDRPRTVANWVTGELFRLMKASATSITEVLVSPSALAGLLRLVDVGAINQNTAKRVLAVMFSTGHSAEQVVRELELAQVSDASELEAAVQAVLAANTDQVEKYRTGKESVFNFLLGQVMRETRGKGNPAVVRKLLLDTLRK
jgi:aspartyl-tRNA(Asn)/glutamyl-tRNA(Gln) amidotransferase subunit B